MTVQLGYIIIYVKDVPSTVAFYQKAFGLQLRFLQESKLYAELETGSTILAFVSEKYIEESYLFRHNRQNDLPAGVEIAFVVDNVEKQFQFALENGCTEVLKPILKPWGQMVSCVRDNNGFLVEICSAMK